MPHHILIADDDPVQLVALRALLTRQGYHVDTAQDGLEALRKIESIHPDLIMSDYMMPSLNGIDLFKKTLRLCPYAIRILITAHGDMKIAMGAINEANVYKFITKPWNAESLLLSVQRALEHHDLMRQIIQTEKMASLGQLAAGVAHEINNPVGFVTSNLTTLTDYMGIIKRLMQKYGLLVETVKRNESMEEVLAQIEDIHIQDNLPFILGDIDPLLQETKEGAVRIGKIVQSLKNFSRTESDKLEQLNVNDCIQQALSLVWNQLKYKCEVEENLGDLPLIQCRPEPLQQVFINVLMNAAQAMPQQGGRITIDTERKGSYLAIRISDSGMGISAENLSRIFDPFFTTKPAGEGTGLGLAISMEIIRKNGGAIEVESTEGQGTTFEIHLPIDGTEIDDECTAQTTHLIGKT